MSDSTGQLNIELPNDPSVTQDAEFLACLCDTGHPVEHLLVLCCYPIHLASIVWVDVTSRYTVIRHGQCTSPHPLSRDDQALVSLPTTIIPCAERNDNEDISLM